MKEPITQKSRSSVSDNNGKLLSGHPVVRSIGFINWRGVWSLYVREVMRFYKISIQTLIAPIVSTLIIFVVFIVSFNESLNGKIDIPLSVFLVPGLIMMAIFQNSFANTSSSILVSKIQGNIIDILMPPLHPFELTLVFTLGGITRGLLVGLLCALAINFIVEIRLYHPLIIIIYAIFSSMMLSLLGLIGGILAEKYDHIAGMTNFVIVPLSFLSGTFFPIDLIPESWRILARFNPFFHTIDGFRYGFTDHLDGELWIGITYILLINLFLSYVALKFFSKGYKLKN